jgi:hypothetical protein
MKGRDYTLFPCLTLILSDPGERDPYRTTGDGAGFVLGWKGNSQLSVGLANEDSELIQIMSDSMHIAIPKWVKCLLLCLVVLIFLLV